MSEQLTICLIATAVNLAGMLIIYAALSYAMTRSKGAIFSAIALTVAAQLFWIGPALWIVRDRNGGEAAAYALWFGNWLVCGFTLLLFSRRATNIPAALSEAARLDGLGGFGTWRHTVLPFVRRDLAIVAIFTVMATLLPFWGFINLPEPANSIVLFERFLSPQGRLAMMIAVSLIGTLPLIGIFFAAKSRP